MNQHKLYLLVREESVFHPALFDTILSTTPPHYTVIGAAMIKNRETLLDSVRHVLRMGGGGDLMRLFGQVMRQRLQLLLRRSPLSSVQQILTYHRLPLEYIATPNEPDFVDRLARRRPDVIFNAAPNILKPPLLDVPIRGCINRHAGRLPDYRGVEPVFQALRNREPQVTITYHQMTPEIDAGIVLWEHHEQVQTSDTVYTLYQRLFSTSNFGFWQAVENLEKGVGRPVNLAQGNYYSWPTATQIAEFRQTNRRYI